MAVEHEHDHAPATSADARPVRVARVADTGVGRAIAIIVGVYFVLVGAWALIGGGVSSLHSPVTSYLGLTGTPLTAIVHIGIGVVSLMGLVGWRLGRGLESLLGAAFTFAAIIVFANPGVLGSWLGLSYNNAVIYLLAGAAEFAGGMLTPGGLFYGRHVTAP
jgi:hypothetical protein